MEKALLDDVYFILYYDSENNLLSTTVAESIEDFSKLTDQVQVIAWCNVTGKEMSVSKIYNQEIPKFIKVIKDIEDEEEEIEEANEDRNPRT